MAGDSIHSTDVPGSHGRNFKTLTGGSTGQPVTTVGTEVTAFCWQVFALRDHFWHRRDFTGKLAAIRYTRNDAALPPEGKLTESWGSSTRGILQTGPGAVLDVDSTTEQQAAWLRRQNPTYLLSYPSCVAALAARFAESPEAISNLREVRTMGEIVEPHVRRACRDAWGVPLADIYTSQEVGYIAIQCPTAEHYHVQEENVFVEVVDEAGEPCGPGRIGKVILTPLHNFAMPLIRYDVGDYAEVGEPCTCGRNLAVLKRILGRQRNMLLLPDGQQRWPSLQLESGLGRSHDLPPIHQMQVLQQTLRDIEVKIVAPRTLTDDEEARLRRYFQNALPPGFSVAFHYVAEIPRSPTGKFEDFRCNVAPERSH